MDAALTGEAALAAFFGGYYRDPRPDVAAAALQVFFADPRAAKSAAADLFVLAARRDPAIALAFSAVAVHQPALAPVVETVLAAAKDAPDPLTRPLEQPGDLDHLWAWFLLTGDEAPVARIAEVVAREDRLLAAFDRWVKAPVWWPWWPNPREARRARLAEAGIGLDPDRERLGNAYDVDLVVWKLMSGGFQVRAELPFALTDQDLLHLAMKGAACWSLQSNAQQHPIVRALYERLPGRARWPAFA